MTLFLDARLPLCFGSASAGGSGTALLVEGEMPVPDGVALARFTPGPVTLHPGGCACCAARSSAAEALSRLFLARARGDVAFFHSVIAVVSGADGRGAVLAALAADPATTARFRLA